jgi:hypothetical protein
MRAILTADAVGSKPPGRVLGRVRHLGPVDFRIPDPELRGAVAAILAERRPDMVVVMVREMQRAVPGYWRMRGTALEADLQSAVSTICDIFITLLREDRAMSEREERMLRGIGGRRARQGIAAEVLRGAVMVASRVGWRYVVECFAEMGPVPAAAATMGASGEALAAFCEATLRILASAYQTARVPGTERAELFAEVLAGPAVGSGPSATAHAERLGHDIFRPHRILLVTGFDPCDDVRDGVSRTAVAEILEALPDAVEVPVTSPLTSHATIAVPSLSHTWPERRALLDKVTIDNPVLVFVAAASCGPVHLRDAYERACRLLRLARSVCNGPGIVDGSDLRLHNLLVDGVDDHRPFVDEVLGPVLRLPAHQRDKLLDTIASLGRVPLRGGLRAASKALNVHEKTIAYRMERIVELTGLDPDLPRHRMQLVLATDLLGLSGWAQPHPRSRVVRVAS